jgi:hypothetical protein
LVARIAKLLSFSNVVACLALFVALGGSVYAAEKLNGKQIKPSSLPGNRIKPKTVPPNRIKPNSLTGTQIKEQTLTGVTAAALTNVKYQATTADVRPGNGPATVTANCPPGAYAIGGGATLSNEEHGYVNDSGPSSLPTGWTATAYSYFPGGVTMTVTAVCVVVKSPGGGVTAGTPKYQTAGPVYQLAE